MTLLLFPAGVHAQQSERPRTAQETRAADTRENTGDWNRRLLEMSRGMESGQREFRLGPEDLLEISVFDAPELSRSVRISSQGQFSLPLLGTVTAVGLTPRELEFVLQELLRRSLMKDPHVSVFVREMQSQPVSISGAVRKPGVVQIRGSKTLLEILSMAEGLAEDAGDTVVVMRGAGFAGARPAEETGNGAAASGEPESVEVNLKLLLDSGDARHNLLVHPGDIVKVARAGIVYVVGEVKRPGGFVMKNNETLTVLQALALGEGLTRTAAQGHARIIRTNELTGERAEIPLNLKRVLAGRDPDPSLQARDIVFVPNSTAKSAMLRGTEAAISIVTGVVIWRR